MLFCSSFGNIWEFSGDCKPLWCDVVTAWVHPSNNLSRGNFVGRGEDSFTKGEPSKKCDCSWNLGPTGGVFPNPNFFCHIWPNWIDLGIWHKEGKGGWQSLWDWHLDWPFKTILDIELFVCFRQNLWRWGGSQGIKLLGPKSQRRYFKGSPSYVNVKKNGVVRSRYWSVGKF